MPAIRRRLPGLGAAIGVALVARFATTFLPPVVSEVTIAILIGLVLGRLPAARSAALAPGLKLAAELLLRLGIVLLGAKLGIDQIAGIGLPAAVVIMVTMAAALWCGCREKLAGVSSKFQRSRASNRPLESFKRNCAVSTASDMFRTNRCAFPNSENWR